MAAATLTQCYCVRDRAKSRSRSACSKGRTSYLVYVTDLLLLRATEVLDLRLQRLWVETNKICRALQNIRGDGCEVQDHPGVTLLIQLRV